LDGAIELGNGIYQVIRREMPRPGDFLQAASAYGYIRSQTQIVLYVCVSDLRSGRNEMRPRRITLDQTLIQKDISDLSWLSGESDLTIRPTPLMTKALALRIHHYGPVLKDRLIGMLPRDEKPLDKEMHDSRRDKG